MSAKNKIVPFAPVAVRKTTARANRTDGPSRPQAGNGKRAPAAAGARSVQLRTQPSYEELLRFFNQSIDLLCIANFEGRFMQLNPAWQPALGWTVQELEARPFIDFVHPDDRSATVAEMEKLASGAVTITFENRYYCQDGSWKWLQWTAAPMPGRDEIYAVARDVTLQKEVEKEIHDALDRERERVGRDLHDSLGPHLAAIGYAASFLTNDLLRGERPEAEQAGQIREMVDEAMSHAQDLARGLVPVQIGGPVLSMALKDLARTTSILRGMSVSFHEKGTTQLETLNDGLHLYRIAQEAVNNSAKHGGAKKVTILLSQIRGSLCLTVVDDGKGLAPRPGGMRGLGLPSMRYRAKALGGELRVESNPGGGTIVTCEIPNYPRSPATFAP